jgi:hypothetical protein
MADPNIPGLGIPNPHEMQFEDDPVLQQTGTPPSGDIPSQESEPPPPAPPAPGEANGSPERAVDETEATPPEVSDSFPVGPLKPYPPLVATENAAYDLRGHASPTDVAVAEAIMAPYFESQRQMWPDKSGRNMLRFTPPPIRGLNGYEFTQRPLHVAPTGFVQEETVFDLPEGGGAFSESGKGFVRGASHITGSSIRAMGASIWLEELQRLEKNKDNQSVWQTMQKLPDMTPEEVTFFKDRIEFAYEGYRIGLGRMGVGRRAADRNNKNWLLGKVDEIVNADDPHAAVEKFVEEVEAVRKGVKDNSIGEEIWEFLTFRGGGVEAFVERIDNLHADLSPVGDLQETFLWGVGKGVERWADIQFQARPNWREKWYVQFSEQLGGTTALLAPMLIPGLRKYSVGNLASMSMGVYANKAEAIDRAIADGATSDEIAEAMLLATIPGMTEYAPLELLMRAPVVRNALLQHAINIGVQALAEGGQEAAQQWMQNAIAKRRNPEQSLTEGMIPSGISGGGVGATMALVKEFGAKMLGVRTITTPDGRTFYTHKGRLVSTAMSEIVPSPDGRRDHGRDHHAERADADGP